MIEAKIRNHWYIVVSVIQEMRSHSVSVCSTEKGGAKTSLHPTNLPSAYYASTLFQVLQISVDTECDLLLKADGQCISRGGEGKGKRSAKHKDWML